MSTYQMSRGELYEYVKTTIINPPHIVFNKEQYERDLNNGLISIPRSINNSPYLPSELKAVHGASSINVTNDTGKKKVVIAITIANNFPPAYIQTCFDVFCKLYGFTLRTIEVINLKPLEQYGNPQISTVVQNQSLIDQINNYQRIIISWNLCFEDAE